MYQIAQNAQNAQSDAFGVLWNEGKAAERLRRFHFAAITFYLFRNGSDGAAGQNWHCV